MPAYIDDNAIDEGPNLECPYPVIKGDYKRLNLTPWPQIPLENRLQCIEAGLTAVIHSITSGEQVFRTTGFEFDQVPGEFVHNPILLEERQRVLKNNNGVDNTVYYDKDGYKMAIFKEYSQDQCNERRLLHLASRDVGNVRGRIALASLVTNDIGLHTPILPPKTQQEIINCLPPDHELPLFKASFDIGKLFF